MRISELAQAGGATVEAVRFYEREKLLDPPARQANGYRDYAPSHLDRLRFIGQCRALDMSLGEIRVLIALLEDPRAECRAVDRVIDGHIASVRSKIAALKVLEAELEALRQRCASPGRTASCGILGELTQAAAAPVRRDPPALSRM